MVVETAPRRGSLEVPEGGFSSRLTLRVAEREQSRGRRSGANHMLMHNLKPPSNRPSGANRLLMHKVSGQTHGVGAYLRRRGGQPPRTHNRSLNIYLNYTVRKVKSIHPGQATVYFLRRFGFRHQCQGRGLRTSPALEPFFPLQRASLSVLHSSQSGVTYGPESPAPVCGFL